MKFEIFNEKNKVVFNTQEKQCLPDKHQINTMIKIGYKFKIDGKLLTKKQLTELINNKEKNIE